MDETDSHSHQEWKKRDALKKGILMSTLNELIETFRRGKPLPVKEITPYLSSDDLNEKIVALGLMAGESLRRGNPQEAINYLEKANEVSGYQDEVVLGNISNICERTNDYEPLVRAIFKWAFRAFEDKRFEEALEAFYAGWFHDGQKLNIKFGQDISFLEKVAKTYGNIAKCYQPEYAITTASQQPRATQKLNIAHIVGNIVDDTHSPTKILKSFIKHHNYERFKVRVYSSEINCQRKRPKFLLQIVSGDSYQRGAKTLNYFKERDIPFYAAPLDGSYIDSALDLAESLREDEIDVALFHSSIACVIEWLVAYWRVAEVQININMGLPMFTPGIDCVTYFAESTFKGDLKYWEKRGIKSCLMSSGVDIDEENKGEPPDRLEFNIPAQGIILSTSGNHLPARMSNEFLKVISKILKGSKDTYYLIIGEGDFSRQKEFFEKENVMDRIRFTGVRWDVPVLIKMIDIYLNEFPAGGGMSVLEAMAAKKPAVDMRYSDEHLHSAGASLVGPDFTIEGKDYEGYVRKVLKLIKDSGFRKESGRKMRKRYEELFSAERMVREFEELSLSFFPEFGTTNKDELAQTINGTTNKHECARKFITTNKHE